jgi:hypothetical protein
MLFAERSEAVTILPDFRSNLMIFCGFRRAKRGGGDFARFSFKFDEFLCFSPSEARRWRFCPIFVQI